MLENYECKFQTRGKIIFVPNARSVRKGRRILRFFSKFKFPKYFAHYESGGHVAALHTHLENKLFFKIDIQNFYYSIARMRVTRALRSWGYPSANTAAQWSCVANPYPGPKHVLPIGFVQSPLLASLVLLKSPIAEAIERAIKNGVCISVYLDDFVGSHDDLAVLETAYNDIRDTCVAAMHQGHFECAITLAAAGEGILPDTDNPHFRQKVVTLEKGLPRDGTGEIRANAYINWLKHGRVSAKEERIENATISKLEVIAVIWRGVSKFIAVYGHSTPQMQTFAIWAAKEIILN